ncbi:MAG: phosphatase PAP2 family protein [Salibacteraceae bacterium]
MFETIENLDRALSITINHFHSPAIDDLMILVSNKLTWIPLYLFVTILMLYKRGLKPTLLFLGICALTVVLTDQISVWMKTEIGRYRPCHNSDLFSLLHLPAGCGGLYGFVSSHAANTMGIAVLVSKAFKKHWITAMMVLYALVNGYSRIYLGKHYLLDVAGGFALGAVIGMATYQLFRVAMNKLK